MKKVLLGLCLCLLIFSSCERKNYVYSNASFNRPYKYDQNWDYKGYNPEINEDAYRRYNPEREDEIVKNLKDRDTTAKQSYF